jgi:hypothetical protein
VPGDFGYAAAMALTLYDIWVVDFSGTGFANAPQDASNNHVFTLNKVAAGAKTALGSFGTELGPGGAWWSPRRSAIGALVDKTNLLNVAVSKNGAPGAVSAFLNVTYRLVG